MYENDKTTGLLLEKKEAGCSVKPELKATALILANTDQDRVTPNWHFFSTENYLYTNSGDAGKLAFMYKHTLQATEVNPGFCLDHSTELENQFKSIT